MNKSCTVLLCTGSLLLAVLRAGANPSGATVQAGSATITHKGTAFTTVNQATDKVIIDWNSFSIGAGEVTRFIQPNANSAALNRVLGGNPTEIYGLLQGNGQVFVINPAGILVGRGGVINTHSFAGSTLDVNDHDFLSGVGLRFSGTSTAAVRNQGTIQALGGDIYLFAHQVENSGSLQAAGGTVGLGAGSEVLLTQSGNEHVHVLAGNISAPATASGVNNVGAIQAATAELKAAGGNIYALAINNGGVVRATTVVNQGGHIYLRAAGGNVQNAGTLDASGRNGGTVVLDAGHNATAPATVVSSGEVNVSGQNGVGGEARITGDRVALVENATVDANGTQGGGRVLVGGGFHGANPDVQNAQQTFVGLDSKISADAVNSGDGGKVVIWSDLATKFYGNISARGGESAGNGGNVEVSSGQLLSYEGNSDLRAGHGKFGTLLLDPDTIEIVDQNNNGGNLDSQLTVGSDTQILWTDPNATTPPPANTLSRGQLEAFGNAANLLIEAKDGIKMDSLASHVLNLAATSGSITFHADGNGDGTGTFTMDPADTIQTQGGAVTITGAGITVGSIVTSGASGQAGGAVTLTSSGGLTVSGNITAKGGAVGNNKDGLAGGAVSLSGSSISVAGNIDTSGSAGNSGASSQVGGAGGAVSMTTSSSAVPGNSITLAGSVTSAGGAGVNGGAAGAAGNISLTANTLNLNGTSAAGSAQVPFNTTVSAIVLNKTGGDTVINETDGVDVSGTTAGNLTVTAGGAITAGSSLVVNGAGKTASLSASGHDITLSDANNDFTTLSVNGANVTVSDKNALDLGASTISGNLSVTTKGNLTDSGNVNVTKTTTLDVGSANNITLNNSDTFGGTVTMLNANNVTLSSQGNIDLAATTIPGTLDVTFGLNGTAGAQLTQSGLLNIGGLSTFHVIANSSDVLVGSFANLFHGVALTAASGGFHDINIHDAAAAPTYVTGLPTSLHSLSLTYENSGIALSAVTASGNLTVTAGGPITQNGALSVSGSAAFKTLNDSGAAINLDQVADTVNNSFGSISAQVRNAADTGNAVADVTIHESKAGGTVLAGVQTGGNLFVVSGGSISETAPLIVNGVGKAANFTISATDSGIALDTQANDLSSFVANVSGTGAHDLGLRNINAAATVPAFPAGLHNLTLAFDNADITLPAVTLGAGGNLKLVSGGNISDSGNIVVPGTTTLQAGTGKDINFSQADDFAGGVTIQGGRDVTINEINSLTISGTVGRNLTTTAGGTTTFGTLQVGNNLNSTANGLISDTGPVTVQGTSTLAAGAANDILLTQADDFGLGVSIGTARDVTLHDINSLTVGGALGRNLTLTAGSSITLNSLNAGGNFNATSVGNISDAGPVTVVGATTLAAGAANTITLNQADNFLGTVTINSAKDVTLNTQNGLTLGPSTISGNLNVTANGLISDNGNLTVAGTTTLAAGVANDINLTKADDFGGSVSVSSAKNVTLNDINGLILGQSTISGNLTVTAGGPISQSGAVTVNTLGSLASFSSPGQSITLNNANNDFVTARLNGSDVSVNDLNALSLGSSTVSGNLTVSAGGPISESGTILANGVGKTAIFTSGSGITLGDANNDFTTVKLNGADVLVIDINGVDLGASTIGGNFTVFAGGSISQSGTLNLTTPGKMATFMAPPGADVLLGAFPNSLGAVTVNVNGVGSLHNLALRNTSSTAALSGLPLAGLNSLTIQFDNAPVNLPATTLTGNLSVTGLGITDSGNIVVGGTTTLATTGSASDIVLNHANDFVLGVNLSGSRDVVLNEINFLGVSGTVAGNLSTSSGAGTRFGSLTVGGNINASANGNIFDSGVIFVAGTTTLAAGPVSDVLLTHADDFGQAVTVNSARDVTLNDVNALTVGGSISRNLTISSGAGLTLNNTVVSGNLTVTAGGNVNDAGPVTVVGNTTVSAGSANNITLSQADDFVGSVSIVSGKDVTLNDVNTLTLGASTISGNLSVTANGFLTDAGSVTVAGNTSLAAGTANNINFSQADDFGGPVNIVSARDVNLNDVNALAVGGVVSGKLSTTSGGPLTLNALNVGGNLLASANGAITDAGAITIGGTTSLAAGGNDVTLSQADDFVGPVNIVSARNVSLNDVNGLTVGGTVSGNLTTSSGGALTLNGLNVAGNLNSTANGLISDAAPLAIAGQTSLSAGAGNNIALGQSDDFVGPVNILSGKDVILNDANTLAVGGSVSGNLTTISGGALTLNALTVGGGLSATANGAISDAGAVSIAGSSSLSAGAGNNITFSQADDFGGAVSVVSGKDVTLNDINGLTVGGTVSGKLTTTSGGSLTFNTLNVAGNLNSTANGLISDAGNLIVSGSTTLGAGAANDITLTKADDFVGPVSVVSAKNVTLNDVNSLSLGASTVAGNLSIVANGPISDAGNVTVAGTTTLAAGVGNNITLTKADDFGGAVSVVTGNNVTLNDVNALTLGASTVSGNLSITANGLISDAGAVTVAGTTTLAAGTANNVNFSQADDFVGPVSITTAKDVSLNDVNTLAVGGAVAGNLTTVSGGALTLNALNVGGNLSATANGVISDAGAVVVSGSSSFAAGAGNNVTLSQADDFVGPVSIVSGKDITLNDINSFSLGASTISGNLSVVANGPISDSGNVTVVGTTTLAAGAANNITLTHQDDFGGPISIVNGKNVTLNDVNALTIGASTISGNLVITANGLVSDSGNITVDGSTTVTPGAGNSVSFTHADTFVGPLTINGAHDVTLVGPSSLIIGALDVSGNLTVVANGLVTDGGVLTVAGNTSLSAGSANDITLNHNDDFVGPVSIVSGRNVTLNDVNGLILGPSTISGNLTVTAKGLISDSGVLTVAGNTSLSAGAANNITLTKADDFVGPVSIVSGKDVTLNDINSLTLGASTISGILTVTANGAISDSGSLSVAGNTVLSAGAANSVTLNHADDFVGPVSIVSGKDVTLNDVNALTLGASTVSGNLSIVANGLVNDSGNVTVAGTTTLAAGAANDISLTKADDFLGGVSVVSGKNVTLNDVNALTLGASTISGNLSLTANGAINDSGTLTVDGTTTLAPGAANDISLTKADDFVGAVSIASGKNVTLNDINALTLGASVISGNLSVTANGLISDAGNVTVAGTTTLAAGAGNNITFTKADDFGGGISIASGKNVTLNDVNALALGASTVSGNLSVTANGLVSDSGNVTVAGTTTLAAGAANDISLTKADDFVGAVSVISGKNVTLNDVNTLTLGASSISGNLSVTASGLISDAGNVIVAGTTTLAAGAGNDITLTKADDFGGAVSVVSGKNVTLNDVNALTLGASTVSGNLSVTANGLISDAGNVTVAGTMTLAAGAANDITLTKADDFGAAVSITSGKNVTLNDVNALTLGASTVSGNLAVTANGLISDSGNVTVAGTTTLSAGAGNDISLTKGDDFVGAVSVASGQNVTLSDVNALTLGASTVGGNLSVTASGLISDAGSVTVAGTTTLAAGAGNDITLTKADDFVGAVSVTSGKNVTLNDVNTLTLGASSISGNLSVTASGLISDAGNVIVAGTTTLAAGAGNDITLTKADDFGGAVSVISGNNVTFNDINALTLGASTVSGNLSVSANGLVSDAGNLTVVGTTTLAAGTANNISFTKADDFGGAVSIVSGKNVTLNDINALTLGASTVSGNLAVTANGLVSDAGNVTVSGTTTLAAGAANDITFAKADDFGGAVSVLSGKNVTLNDVNALTLGSSTVSGNLAVTANGLVSDSGNVTVAGTTTLAAGAANDITLTKADDFGGAVSVLNAKNVTLNDVNTLTLGASTVSGNLSLTANGLISDAGNVTVAGTTTLAAGAGNDITLTKADDFGGALSVVSGKNVTLNDVNALTLGASTVSGNLSITANGLISDAGNVTVAGTTTFAAGAANDITLTKADDFGGAVSIASGKNVTLNDVNALTLGSSTVSGNLAVSANGLISDSGNVTVAGTTTLSAGTANDITLDNADDFVGGVSVVSGKNVTLNDVNALTLAASTVSGNLSVTANGPITDSGNLTVAGTTALAAGAANDITLTKADDFVGAVSILSGNNVTLNDVNALTLGASTVSGNLSVAANGLISDSGNVTVAGATTLSAGAANDISLTKADDFVGSVSIVTAKNVTLNDINALALGASTVSGNLSVSANGLISDSGNVTVAGTTTLAAGAANDISLTKADDFGGAVSIVSGKDVTLNDINSLTVGGTISGKLNTSSGGALTLNALTVGGDLNSTANGPISDAGAIVINGSTTLAAGTGNNITLSQADDFVGPVTIASANDVTLNDINTLTVGGAVSGKLTTTSGGALTFNVLNVAGDLSSTANGLISDVGAVTVGGSTALAAGSANNITLSQADDFVGPVNIVSGKDVTLNDINTLTVGGSVSGKLTTTSAGALTLNTLSVGGDLNSTANGLISDAGAVVVGGSTTLAAGNGNNITLSQLDDFVGPVNIVSGNDVLLNDINSLSVGGSVSGKLTTTSGGALTLNALTVGGNLSSTANGPINDAGAVVVGGSTALAAGTGNNIHLSQADDFVGPVNIVSGKDVTLNDINTLAVGGTVSGKLTTTSGGALTLDALTVAGNLSSTANGPISDAGAVVVNGSTTLAAGTGNNITLSQADDFVGPVNITSAKDVSLNDINTLTVGGNVSGQLSTVSGGALTLNALTVGGNLSSTANGAISDAGAVVVSGTTTLAAGAGNNITLSQADDFVGPVSIVSGKDVSLNDVNALTLGASTVSGNLSVTANGLISDVGNLVVSGTTTLAAGAGNNITLSQADDFVGAVSIVSGKDVTLNDINALTLGPSTVSGNLAVTANGLISDSGNITVAGATSLSAGANDVSLSHADDFVGPVSIASANNVTINDVNALTIGASTVSGNLSLTANGLISDSGPLLVLGTTTLAAGSANNIIFNHSDNFIGAVSIVSGNDVTLNNVNALILGASTVSGNLDVTAGGAITQTGTIIDKTPGKIASFTASGNTITLNDPNNDFATIRFAGSDVSVNDVNALDFGASTISGNLTVTAGGALTQSGTIIANTAGKTALFSAPGNSVTLTDPNNDFATVKVLGSEVALNDVNALDLGASTVSGNLTVTAGGAISQSGTLSVSTAGTTASFNAPGQGITLNDANNDFATAKFSGADVSVNDVNALDIGQSQVTGTLTVSANGPITQSGIITANTAGKLASFTAGSANDVTLGLANDFAEVSVPAARNVLLRDANGFKLSTVKADGTLSLNTVAGNIVELLDGSTVKAKTLTGQVNGSLILGNPANASLTPAEQFISASQPANDIASISTLGHNGDLFVYNSHTVAYGGVGHPGEIANPLPQQDPTAVLGLKITGPITGHGLTTIRTAGDLVILGSGKITTTEGDIELSAESSTTASGNFHNLAGTVTAGGTPVPNPVIGANAVIAGTDYLDHKPGATPSRFLIFSTDAKQNYGELLSGGRVTFNGLGADFVADQITFGNHVSPIIKQNAQPDNGTGNGFVFVQKQAILQTDETAKFFFDLLNLVVVNAIDATAEVDKLPPERPPTIWTSSYHLYIEENKKKKKTVSAEHQVPVVALNLAGE